MLAKPEIALVYIMLGARGKAPAMISAQHHSFINQPLRLKARSSHKKAQEAQIVSSRSSWFLCFFAAWKNCKEL